MAAHFKALWAGTCYLKGNGCDKDYAKALDIFESSLLVDNSQRICYLGVMYFLVQVFLKT